MHDLLGVLERLVWEGIPFTVHYPSGDSAVITVSTQVTNSQLSALAELGASHNPQNHFMILCLNIETNASLDG